MLNIPHVLLSCMTPGEEDPEQKIGPIPATRAVRTEIQRFKIDHGLKTANDVIVFLLNAYEEREKNSNEGRVI